MSTQEPPSEPPIDRSAEADHTGDEPEAVPLPKWVPTLVAVALVAMAAAAVYTGLRYRGGPFRNAFGRRAHTVTVPEVGGPPGEPQPGASRVNPGDLGENAPAPSAETYTQSSRVAISGGGKAGLSTTVRTSARRGFWLKVDPPTAMLYVNDSAIGTANQFASADEAYEFPAEGNFTVRLTAPGHKDAVYYITADPNAKDEVLVIERALDK